MVVTLTPDLLVVSPVNQTPLEMVPTVPENLVAKEHTQLWLQATVLPTAIGIGGRGSQACSHGSSSSLNGGSHDLGGSTHYPSDTGGNACYCSGTVSIKASVTLEAKR